MSLGRTALRRENVAVVGLACLALATGLAFFERELAPWGDNGQFIIVAKSIVSGHGLREINHPQEPVHRKYPLGLPLLLAGVERLKPDAVVAMKIVVLVHFVLSAMLCYWLVLMWTQRRLLAFLVGALLCTNALALQFASEVMSEVPFLCVSLLALVLHEKQEQAGDRSAGRWYFGGATLASVWALLLRSVGIALVGAICVRLALKRRWARAVGLAAAAGSTFLLHRLLRGAGPDEYLSAYVLVDYYDAAKGHLGLGGFFERMLGNLGKYGLDLVPASLLAWHTWWPLLFLVALLVAAGLVGLLRKAHVAALYFGGSLLLLLAWPRIWAVPRYLVPLLPFSLLFVLIALSWPRDWLARRGHPLPTWVAWVAAAALASTLALANLVDAARYQPGKDPRWQRYVAAMAWLRDNTPADAVVLCRKPYLGFLMSKRRTVGVVRSSGEQLLFDDLDRNHVGYVVVDSLPLPGTREILIPAVKAHRDRFALVYRRRNPPLWIFGYRAVP